MLLTNDGELANRLTHPRYGHEKEYRVLVARHPDQEQLDTWRRGVVLEDGHRTAPAVVRVESLAGKGAWLRVILREGRKRQIRETGSQLGLPVVKIIRIRIGSLQLGGMKPRDWRYLSSNEVDELKGKATPAGRPIKSDPRRPRRVGASSQPGRPTGRSRSGGPAKKSISKPEASSQTGKPGRRQGGSSGAKPGVSRGGLALPARPASPPKKTERRAPRGPKEKGKHK
jgi:23S rRNA pseudouridine2605 synthase